MSVSPDQFWMSLSDSGLISDQELESLRARLGRNESIANSSTKIARLLIANGVLSEKQARGLLSGRSLKTGVKSPPLPNVKKPPIASGEDATVAKHAGHRKDKSKLPVILCIGTTLFILVAAGAYFMLQPKDTDAVDDLSKAAATPTTIGEQDNLAFEYVESDEALWAREHPGQPIALQYAPVGVQTIVCLRLAELLAHPEGKKVIRSLGPTLENALANWLQRIGTTGELLEELELHLLPQGTTLPRLVAVGKLRSGTSHTSLPAFANKNNNRIAKLATDSIWFPEEDQQRFVFGPADDVAKLAAPPNATDTPVLRRELEQLRLASHDTDSLTILSNPNFLRDEAQGLFPDTRRRLLDGLYDFWSEEAQAVSVGIQLTDVAIVEVRMIAREDLPPRRFAAIVENKLASFPSKTIDFLGQAELDPYWQPLAFRFPAMVRFVKEQARIVVEGKQVAVSTALPAEAVHNLLLASELSLASSIRSVTSTETVNRSNWTIDDVLKSKIDVQFAQKSLEVAMRDVMQQVRDEFSGLPFEFTAEIDGTDLEPEGITRNQQIRDFVETDGSVADVLTRLVMKANPIQTVTAASETDQKLVWAVSSAAEGKILITTRAAVQAKRIPLPAEFLP